MSNLMKTDDREIKKDKPKKDLDKISRIKNKISDDSYVDQAILEIATELSHYLTK